MNMQNNKIKSMRVLTIMLLSFFLTGLQVKSQTVITVQPSTLTRVACKNGTAISLSVNATLPQGTTLFYQWFKNTANSYVNAIPIANANANTLNFVSSEAGVFYLFCQVVPTFIYYYRGPNDVSASFPDTSMYLPSSGIMMSQNLSVVNYNNGDPIPLVTNATTWANLKTGAYCYPNNDPTQVATKGLLYNWFALNDPRGIVPTGWKVFSKEEWLLMYLQGFTTVDNVGYRDKNGNFFNKYAYWWSRTEDWEKTAWLRIFYEGQMKYDLLIEDKRTGLSVRCVKE
jgi:hypothetical protein